MDFHSHFSYDSDHNAATACAHMKSSFTKYMRISFIKYGILYDTIDGCSKQYSSLWVLSVLVFRYIVMINRCINALGHGRRKIDVINEYEN